MTASVYCPWSGKKDCGCTAFPDLWEGLMPKECESHLTLASAEVHVQARRVSPAMTAEVKRWVAAGRPRLDRWVGEDDGD